MPSIYPTITKGFCGCGLIALFVAFKTAFAADQYLQPSLNSMTSDRLIALPCLNRVHPVMLQ